MQSKPVHYLQWDNRWGGIMFSNHGDRSQTIASSGCGATSMAMVAAAFIDPAIDPPTLAGFIVANGYRTYNNGVDWGFFPFAADYYKLPFKQSGSTDEAIQALRDGALIVASMGPGYFTSFGHYILLWGLDSAGNILCNDPNSEARTQASYELFREQAANYFIFYPKEETKKMPEQWKIDIVNQAKAAGLITSDHDPEEPVEFWELLAVCLNVIEAVKNGR